MRYPFPRKVLERNMTGAEEECGACAKARSYYSSCLDPGGRLERLGGRPLVQLLDSFYWNVTDFDGGTQMDAWKLQVSLHLHSSTKAAHRKVFNCQLTRSDGCRQCWRRCSTATTWAGCSCGTWARTTRTPADTCSRSQQRGNMFLQN